MDLAPLIKKIKVNFNEIEVQLSNPEIFEDRQNYEKISREHQRLLSLISIYDELENCENELNDNMQLLENEDDDEFCEVIRTENTSLEEKIAIINNKVINLILPPGENDSRNTIVEIRPAAGGDEAGLFSNDLLRMYQKLAERKKWRIEILHMTESSVGGLKDAAFSMTGDNVYRSMQYESGVHRVQRIPTTETSGRIHTSTVTVAVLPEAKDIEIKVSPEDLRIDVFRSSGPGGQSVNTTDSAVRITHIPTGLSVASQQEKSQHRNKEIAMRILRSRILEARQLEETEKHARERKTQIGTGERSERIRTYNFPQNRVTDHRFGVSHFNLPQILEGEIELLIEEIIAVDSKRKLEEEVN